MKIRLFVCAFILLVSCKEKPLHKEIENQMMYSVSDYFHDKELIDELRTVSDCDSIIYLFNKIKTIDFLSKKEKRLNECGVDFINPYNVRGYEKYPKVYQTLSEIITDDQIIRDSLNNTLAYTREKMTAQQYMLFTRSFLSDTDSLNAVRFDSLLNSLGEWVGAKYREMHPSSPRIELFISHLNVDQYMKYTYMAYHSAQVGEEYWSRVILLIRFAQKFILHDIDILEQRIYIVPFRFAEYTNEFSLDEDSDLTILEFQNLSNNDLAHSGEIQYELVSSYPNDTDRKLLLDQAQSLLVKQGLPAKHIVVNYTKDTLSTHKLSYKIKH